MAYKVIILYQLYMPSYFLGTFTEYPYIHVYPKPRYIFSFCSDSGFCVVRPVRLDRSVKAFLH